MPPAHSDHATTPTSAANLTAVNLTPLVLALRGSIPLTADLPPDLPAHWPPPLQRKHFADVCRLIGQCLSAPADNLPPLRPVPPLPHLPPRARQVLDQLLTGKSEKEAARALGLSAHTVHVHVKTLHRRLHVTSRAELLTRCLLPHTPPLGPASISPAPIASPVPRR